MRVQIVSFHCTLKNKFGQVLSSSINHDVYTTPKAGEVAELPGLVEAMKNLRLGEKREIFLKAEDAYGFYDPKWVFKAPRSRLSKGKTLKRGDTVFGKFIEDDEPRMYRVTESLDETVVLDGNHPLAGQDLIFVVEVLALREENQTDLDSHPLQSQELH